MARWLDTTKLIAMALVAIALLGAVTPACAMPDCDDISAGTCSDFKPACDDCPDQVVMKHTHDEALTTSALATEPPATCAVVDAPPNPAVFWIAFTAPEATASPPPLDPLGVRLTI